MANLCAEHRVQRAGALNRIRVRKSRTGQLVPEVRIPAETVSQLLAAIDRLDSAETAMRAAARENGRTLGPRTVEIFNGVADLHYAIDPCVEEAMRDLAEAQRLR